MYNFEPLFPSKIRFDDRKLSGATRDNGSDFEKFVYEVFSVLEPATGGFRTSLGGSRDGAIDISSGHADQLNIIECKFIGKTASSEPKDRWREVYTNLKNNLPKLLQRPKDKRATSPYAPWLSTSTPVRQYKFCVSATCAHEQERQRLKERIEGDFKKVSQLDSSLDHLSNIDVSVVFWDDLHIKISNSFPLRYRWFGGLPDGLSPLAANDRELKTFKRFLNSEHLPYQSREKYLKIENSNISSEQSIIERMASETDPCEAMVISGPGGAGKTRLGFELCRILENQGWIACRLHDNVKETALEALAAAHSKIARVVLLLDYAEAANALPAIAQKVSKLNEQHQHKFRLIATCRTSALNNVKSNLTEVLNEEVLELGQMSREQSPTFESWVIDGILSEVPKSDREGIATTCNGLPVLAAFALYLYKNHKHLYNQQFTNLFELPDFSNWAERRTKFLRRKFGNVKAKRALASLALILPLPHAQQKDFTKRGELELQLFENLVSDRWIEREGDSWVVVHDVFADTLLAEYLLESPAVATLRLEGLLQNIENHEQINLSLIAINRIAHLEKINRIDGVSVLSNLWQGKQTFVLENPASFLNSHLINNEQKILFIKNSPELLQATCKSHECYGVVQNIAEQLAIQKETSAKWRSQYHNTLKSLFDGTLHQEGTNNKLLKYAFMIMPNEYQKKLLDYIKNHPIRYQTHFLLFAAISENVPLTILYPHIEAWLSGPFQTTNGASFIIKAWLDSGGDIALIREPILAWLKEHKSTEDAQYLYTSWLDAGGDIDFVIEPISIWLEIHGSLECAQYIYTAWLNAGGESEFICKSIFAWFEKYKHLEIAEYPYSAWLNAGADIAPVKDHICEWLEYNKSSESSQYVYIAWLDAGGEIAFVREYILIWLQDHKSSIGAQYLYTAWLKAGGEVDLVREPILAQLEEHKPSQNAQYLYNAWLNAGGKTDFVRTLVLAWLEEYKSLAEAQYLYVAWLDAKGELDFISDAIITWIQKHKVSEGAGYVYTAWLDAKGSFSEIETDLHEWFRIYYNEPFSVGPLKYLVRKQAPFDISKKILVWCLKYSSDPNTIWRIISLSRTNEDTFFRQGTAIVFAKVLKELDLGRFCIGNQYSDDDQNSLAFYTCQALNRSLACAGLEKVINMFDPLHVRLIVETDIYELAHAQGALTDAISLLKNTLKLINDKHLCISKDRKHLNRMIQSFQKHEQDIEVEELLEKLLEKLGQ